MTMKKLNFILKYCLILMIINLNNSYGNVLKVPLNYSKIQDAMDAASVHDTVLVDEGTYFENIDFKGKNIVVASKYILDENTDHILNTIIDGSNGMTSDNGSCVIFKNNEDSTAVIQGFTLTHGSGSNTEQWREGGAIILQGSSATIKNNLLIDNNVPDGGGAISSFRPSSTVHIYNNIITQNVGSGYAGGIVLNWTGGIVRNNIIFNNETGARFGGGGVLTWDFASNTVIIENNTIVGNKSGITAGGISTNRSGAPVIRNNIIWGNIQASGGQNLLTATAVFEYNNTVESIEGDGNISVDPEFSDILYKLKDVSSCIDAGNPDSKFNDLDETTNDLGAYGGPYATPFPEFTYENISAESDLIFTMNVGEALTRKIILWNIGTTTVQIDSVVFPENIKGIQSDAKFNGYEIQSSAFDTLSVKITAEDKTFINDYVLIYHNVSNIPNPSKIPIVLNTQSNSSTPEADVRAHWKFEEESGGVVIDENSLSYGVINGEDVTHTTCLDGKGLDFGVNSTNSRIVVPHNDSLDFKVGQSFAVSVLVKCDPISSVGEVYLVFKGSTGGIGKWYGLAFKNKQLTFAVDDNITKTALSYSLPDNYDVEKWHHIVGVRDVAAQKINLYVDGSKVGTLNDNTKQTIENGLPLILKNYSLGEDTYMDDVIIYSKSLSDKDVADLYSSYDLPALSSDASVKSISVDGYDFNEGAFKSETTSYTVDIPDNISSANIIVETNDETAIVTGDGIFKTLPGIATITVNSQDFSSTNVYTIDFSTYTSVNQVLNNNKIVWFPNPVSDILCLNVDMDFIGKDLILYNSVGKNIINKKIENNRMSIELKDVEPGIYILQVGDRFDKVVIQ